MYKDSERNPILSHSDVVPINEHRLFHMPKVPKYDEHVLRTAPDGITDSVLIWKTGAGGDHLFCTNYDPSQPRTTADAVRQYAPREGQTRKVIVVTGGGAGDFNEIIKEATGMNPEVIRTNGEHQLHAKRSMDKEQPSRKVEVTDYNGELIYSSEI